MDFELQPDAGTPSPDSTSADDATEFRLHAEPRVESAPSAIPPTPTDELPRTYGTRTLSLMPRDPYTLFAYWDIDWEEAFADEAPPDRTVHLRVVDGTGLEQAIVSVEPLARSCSVSVREADRSYSAELGWFRSGGDWVSLATSDAAITPPDAMDDGTSMELTTIPFHLSFQRMLDVLRVPKHERGSLTAALADLRARATEGPNAVAAAPQITFAEREVFQAIEEVVAAEPPTAGRDAGSESPIAWPQERLARMLGLRASSPVGGFGGSSRA